MFSLLRFKPFSRVGVDIQADRVRLVQFTKKNKHVCPPKMAEKKLPVGAIRENRIADPDAVLGVLEELVKVTATRGQPVAVALPLSAVILKTILPPKKMTAFECEIEIATHLARYLSGVTDVHFDFVMRADDVLLVAAKNEMIAMYQELVMAAGLSLAKIDVDIYALTRALYYQYRYAMFVAVDVTPARIYFLVVHHGDIIFHQTFYETKNFLESFSRVSKEISLLHPGFLAEKILLSNTCAASLLTSLQTYTSIAVELYEHDFMIAKGLALSGIFYDRN